MRADAATLRLALFPRTGLLADGVLVVAGAALVALAAQIELHLPFTPVPVTGQTFAVLLVGASLGAVRGLATLSLYLAAGVAGVPVYAGGEGGWEWLRGATGGYLVGFVVAAALTGWLAEQRWDRRFPSAVAALLTGNVAVYLFGLPWLARALDTGFERTLELGLYPFVVGDVVKLYLAGALLPSAWRVVERVSATRRPPSPASARARRSGARNT
ncbi:MAG: biotin transporter BioY [Actinomycetota bacterium]|nr:biotin transporter BioY [Actinomycetota bacterium]